MAETFADPDGAARARDRMTDRLLAAGDITTPRVERAFRVVPREAFMPAGTSLDEAYNRDDSVTVKTDERGLVISSISAAFIQARMIEQGGVGPGMTVLEIGSGGPNAALLAEVVGREGRVVSVDIDAEVTDRARARLEATGYGDRVTVVQADAEDPIPDVGTVDAVLVTVGAWDIPPSWIGHLGPDGRLVVPLRMNGITRSVAFTRAGAHLESRSVEVCGFVPMQGHGAHQEHVLHLPDDHGHTVNLQFDTAPTGEPSALDGVLAADRTELWSGVTVRHGTSFADLHLWCACFLPGFCRVSAEPGTELADQPAGKDWFPFGAIDTGSDTGPEGPDTGSVTGSFVYLAVRPALDGAGVEFGARGWGTGAAGTAFVEQIRAWDAAGRPAPERIAYWPSSPDRPPAVVSTAGANAREAVLEKRHGVVTISWPR